MFEKRMSRITYAFFILVTLLIAFAVIMPTMALGQSAGQTSIKITETSALPWPVTKHEIELKNDYKIPTEKEKAETKKKKMESREYKEEAKNIGMVQAEQKLDKKLKDDLDYMIIENAKGSTKIEVMEVGDHSSWYSTYSFNMNGYGQCTTQIADPMNIQFFNKGSWNSSAMHLYYKGWDVITTGDTQCAWTANHAPLYSEAVSTLKPQRTQMSKGILGLLDRTHIRIWDAPYVSGEGYWSVAAVHKERLKVGTSWYIFPTAINHCLIPANNGPGDSFDVAEATVADSLYYMPRYYFSVGNRQSFLSCNSWVWNDGVMLALDVQVAY